MGSVWARSQWLRVSLGALACTFGFVIFYSAVPSAFLAWSDTWSWVEASKTLGIAGLGPRLRDVIVVGYYGVITPLTFVAFSLYQRFNPVNADPDEAKRDAGGYR
jgi:hypothetical protein